ncbi:MAG: hypothetical protein H0A76_09435 [Candidatus Thiodubiliella endoseptemdiera]|uniref:Uncharacterized protein n=1 Tax=Candidatus Thiodubiliella endoseptemdiera TaxID=2738886 RepID=A0A853F8S7_9GAMM|nr:hypothetical protein [Candidatus Thiodubiliella endoseptemdiera]
MKTIPPIIYQTEDGKIKIETHFKVKRLLNQKQIAALLTKIGMYYQAY